MKNSNIKEQSRELAEKIQNELNPDWIAIRDTDGVVIAKKGNSKHYFSPNGMILKVTERHSHKEKIVWA